METLIATVLLIVIFMVTSLVINTLFSATITHNAQNVVAHLDVLEYKYQHQQLHVPYAAVHDDWEITVSNVHENAMTYILFKATNKQTLKTITKTTIANDKEP